MSYEFCCKVITNVIDCGERLVSEMAW